MIEFTKQITLNYIFKEAILDFACINRFLLPT